MSSTEQLVTVVAMRDHSGMFHVIIRDAVVLTLQSDTLVFSAFEITCIVSSGALNSTHSPLDHCQQQCLIISVLHSWAIVVPVERYDI